MLEKQSQMHNKVCIQIITQPSVHITLYVRTIILAVIFQLCLSEVVTPCRSRTTPHCSGPGILSISQSNHKMSIYKVPL